MDHYQPGKFIHSIQENAFGLRYRLLRFGVKAIYLDGYKISTTKWSLFPCPVQGNRILNLFVSVHPEMANLPDIGVAGKILSTEYQPYASGKLFHAP